jgi:hypothetical protein
MMGRIALCAALALAASVSAAAQGYRIDLKRAISWDKLQLEASSTLDLASARLKLPTGRSQAEEIADMEFPRLVQPTILALPVDSSATVGDMIEAGSLTLNDVVTTVSMARRSAPVLSTDLGTLSVAYSIDLHSLSARLVRHRQAAEPKRTLEGRATRPYTGIVIYAEDPLVVHGRHDVERARACFFPKIWDSNMNLIYERNMVEPELARERGIVRYVSVREAEKGGPAFTDLVGSSPLRILASGLFGIRTTDPIIDRDDALKITSSVENRRLLREGRVVIVLGEEALRALP